MDQQTTTQVEQLLYRRFPHITFTSDELSRLRKYPVKVLAAASASTRSWTEHQRTKGIEVHSRGVFTSILKDAQWRTAKAQPTAAQQAENVQHQFQNICTDGSYTLTTEEAQSLLLHSNSIAEITDAFRTTATWETMQEPKPSQQETIDYAFYLIATSKKSTGAQQR